MAPAAQLQHALGHEGSESLRHSCHLNANTAQPAGACSCICRTQVLRTKLIHASVSQYTRIANFHDLWKHQALIDTNTGSLRTYSNTMEGGKRPPVEEDGADEEEAGPPRPPEGLDDEPDVGPAPPKAKKRKVRCMHQAVGMNVHYCCTTAPLLRCMHRSNRMHRCMRRCFALLLQVLQFEQQYLDALPSAQMYEKSYMHRDTITHTVVRALFARLEAAILLLSQHLLQLQ